MAKSLLHNLSVEDKPNRKVSAGHEFKHPSQQKKPATSTNKSATINVAFEFRSHDQAIAISRILRYQVEKLTDQADKHDKSKLTYIADMLREHADVIEAMANKIKKASE